MVIRIDYLVAEINKDDSAASSYWRKYHSSFRFTGDGFEGLQAFGRAEKPYRGLRSGLHRLFQRRFRRMGEGLSRFEEIDRLADDITSRQRRAYDVDVLRHALTLAFLKKHVSIMASSLPATVCVIGDGFALMTALLLGSASASRVVLINLTKTLLVDLWYLKLWMGEAFESSVDLVTDERGLFLALAKSATNEAGGGRVVAIQASDHQLLQQCPVDIALNIASMQEMDTPVIAAYFEDMRVIASQRNMVFYCCNREEKTLPDGMVTRFAEYPWHEADQVFVDELCPWHQYYYVLRPPFFMPYDGLIRHRLVTLS